MRSNVPTFLLGPDDVFSNMMYLPSGETSLMAIGPVDVRWYVVLADTSPRIIFMLTWESETPGEKGLEHVLADGVEYIVIGALIKIYIWVCSWSM